MSVLDEAALRRPEFAEGVPVRLWDGQEWTLPRPTLSGFYPRRGPDGRWQAAPGLACGEGGADYNELVDAWLDAEDPLDQLGRLMEVAAHLLLVNYDLADRDLARLLFRVPATDPRYDECAAMWSSVAEVALGRGPKPTLDG